MHTGNQLDMHGRRSKPSAELTSLIDRGLLPEDASLAAEAPAFTDNPFQLGIASGEPHPDGFVIWTRLAPDPLAEDGSGGMPNRNVPVRWEVAEDEHFRKIVKQGTATALAELGHSVHVEIHGLKPSKILLVQIQSRSGDQPDRPDENRASPYVDLSGMSFSLASCQAWYHGYFTAYRHMAEDHPDVVFFLGDYIYEYPINENNLYRDVKLSSAHNAKTVTLSQYRLRYSLFKTDPDLQNIHALAPWVTTMDDHEVENNYA
ncbi:alkaline phosphatase D family protein [Bacillus sonorensis]|nr:alkaline phosphatase D family protein [Bacillus sonorensis]